MGLESGIEWTESTWNPVTGCTKVSAGCKYCYAERMARRLQAIGLPQYANGFRVTLQPSVLDLPRRWKHPRIIFVNSMSDLFHEDVPLAYIERVFDVICDCPHHTFQILTKRPERASMLSKKLQWPSNIWMGTSVENDKMIHRIDQLRQIPSIVRFLSLEPLLGPLAQLRLDDIHWVIVGGESGPNSRPMQEAWVDDILRCCIRSNVPFFFKQWGGKNKKKTGRLLHGRTWDEMPRVPSMSGTIRYATQGG